jgi:peptide/nickel transport system permease protein
LPETAVLDKDARGVSPLRMALRSFRGHRSAMLGMGILAVLYIVAIFAEFIAPYGRDNQVRDLQWMPPTRLRFSDERGASWRPFIHPIRGYIDPNTFEVKQEEDRTQRAYIRFFAPGEPYKLFGLIPANRHLFQFDDIKPTANENGDQYYTRFYLFGSDLSGRDIFSRICYGSRVSMTIGLVGASIVFVIGMLVGGIAGYPGGLTDDLLMRLCEMIMLLPAFYLLLMLRFVFPMDLDSRAVYFAIVFILALVGWAGFARVIRGMVLSIKSNDFVMAARALGMTHWRVITRHVLPNTLSYAIVQVTLTIPAYIIGESALSILGLGITEPIPSWGNMLQKAMDITELQQHPWVLWPGAFIFIAVMAFNLVGDGLRDSFDPKLRKRD